MLILSQYVKPRYAMRLIEEHPERVGYLLKERVFDVANLIDALRRLADGETVTDPTIVARLFARKRRADPLDKLTEREREREVLALAVEGLSNRAIAARPFVTERTIEAHVKQILLKPTWLSCQQAKTLFYEASDVATLHQLWHSALTHDAEAERRRLDRKVHPDSEAFTSTGHSYMRPLCPFDPLPVSDLDQLFCHA